MSHIALDTIGADSNNIPLSTETVLGYVTGSGGVKWTSEQFARFVHSGVGRIDQDDNPDPHVGQIFDMEAGAGREAQAVEYCKAKLRIGSKGIVYLSASGLPALEDALRNGRVGDYYIHLADWGMGREAATQKLGDHIRAVQFASPTSDPNMPVPGSHLTLSQANIDVSVCLDDYFPPPRPLQRPHGTANAHLSLDLITGRWDIHPLPGDIRLDPSVDTDFARVGFDLHTGKWHVQRDTTE